MDGKLHIVSVNQDPLVTPRRRNGAAVHLNSMRRAFRQLGARVSEVDESDKDQTEEKLARISENAPVSMIYERYALGRSCAARFARKRGIPYALEVNAPLADLQPSCWRGQMQSEKDKREDLVTFGAASFIRAVSSQVAYYARVRGGRNDSICVCPNGIETSVFTTGIHRERRLPHKPPRDRFVLGFHGRERSHHRFEILVDVTRALLARSYPVHLFVVGNGEFKELARLPPCSYTRMGWVGHEDAPAYVSSFDVLPLTYSPESACYHSPMKLMEAMACGVVPIVPELGDLPRLVSHGGNGLVYTPGNPAALFDQLVALISDREKQRQLSRRAAQDARAYEWSGIAGMILGRLGLGGDEFSIGLAVSQ